MVDAQVLDLLAATIDRVDMMTNFEFLVLPDVRLGPLACDVRHCIPDSPLLFALQLGPCNVEGVHGSSAVLSAGGDGLVFHHLTDFLTDEALDRRKCAEQRELAGG